MNDSSKNIKAVQKMVETKINCPKKEHQNKKKDHPKSSKMSRYAYNFTKKEPFNVNISPLCQIDCKQDF